jgi:hypothetical protein
MRTLILLLALAAPFAGQERKPETKGAAKEQTQAFRGVIDQKESEFVLADADTMAPIATLRGRGFHKDNFARFVGMPVEVRGTLVTENGAKVLHVRRIEDIRTVPVKPEP